MEVFDTNGLRNRSTREEIRMHLEQHKYHQSYGGIVLTYVDENSVTPVFVLGLNIIIRVASSLLSFSFQLWAMVPIKNRPCEEASKILNIEKSGS